MRQLQPRSRLSQQLLLMQTCSLAFGFVVLSLSHYLSLMIFPVLVIQSVSIIRAPQYGQVVASVVMDPVANTVVNLEYEGVGVALLVWMVMV